MTVPLLASRRAAVLTGLVLGAAVAGATAVPWVTATTSSAVDDVVPVVATGTTAAPGAGAAGLVVVAASLALALGGRWGRVVAGAGIALGGLLASASAAAVLRGAEEVAASAARQAVGVAVLDAPATLTWAPWAVLVLGALTAAHGVAVAVVSRRWSDPSARHDRTSPTPDAPPSPGAPSAVPPGSPSGVPPRPEDDWDVLSRGEDPSAHDDSRHGPREAPRAAD